MALPLSPLRLRVQRPSGDLSQWARNWLRKLASVEGLAVETEPTAAQDGAWAAPDRSDIDLWPGTIRDNLGDDGRAPCEWAIVDPDGTPVLEMARTLERVVDGTGWELLLLERDGPTSPWCLRRRAHVDCPPRRESALQALADAAVRLVGQGAVDRALGNPVYAVPAGFAGLIGRSTGRVAAVPSWNRLRLAWRGWYERQRARFVTEHWCIGYIEAPIEAVLSQQRLEVRWLTRPDSRGYWADPFGLPGDRERLSCEFFDERTGIGHLETLTLDEDGTIRFRERLEVGEGEHTSFPAVFEIDGERFGLAETAALRAITLHAVDAHGRWTPVVDLLQDVQAADPVLFKAEGRYWLAYTDLSLGAMDNLCLMYADDLEGPWRAHANNPVKVDIRGARMAGRPFVHGGQLYRPAQDCLHTYGSAVVIHRIEHLSPWRFEETVVRRLEADVQAHLPHGMHTISAWGNRTLVDAKIERMNPVAWMRKLRERVGLSPRTAAPLPRGPERVFVYIPSLKTGGGEISMLRVAEGLAERGLDVEVVVHDSSVREQALPRGVTLIDLQAQGTRQAIRRLAQRIRKRSPRWVISAFPHTNLATVLACRLARTGTLSVITEHAPLTQQILQQDNWRYRGLPLLLRAGYRRADAIVSVSAGVRDDLRQLIGKDVRIQTIHNPVLPDDFEQAAEAPADHPWLQDPGLQVVMSMCRLSEEKDLPTLIRAFERIHAAHPCARLLMVGEGPDRERLQGLIDRAGLGAVADLPGRTDQPLAWMRRASVFVLASTFEGYGNVLVEALAVGTPVISTDCPVGPREILENGRFGQLVPVGDDAAMARALGQVLNARWIPEGAMQAARRRTQSKACDEYLALLRHLDISRRSPC